jgi:Rps23 Pro-64 3,4-dihydroxylase Tpa1-like proline 4-hydroxylase
MELPVRELVKHTDTLTQIPAFYFDRESLSELAQQNSQAFQSAQPFPYVVIDNFLPQDIAELIAAEFPSPDAINWRVDGPGDAKHTGDKYIEKIQTSNESLFPPFIRHIMHEFNSGLMAKFVEQITGFPMVSPDPHYHGCGMHSTGRGGRLMVHADASRHPNPKFHQVINLIYYATPHWQEEYGGHLELWSKDAKQMEERIMPAFNRCVIFYTGSNTYHGHPHPLTCPEGIRRNSLAVYYYTTEPVLEETYKSYVEWIPTNELDQQRTPFQALKSFARPVLPAPVLNSAAAFYRKFFKNKGKK